MTTLICTSDAFYSDSRICAGDDILTDDGEKIIIFNGYVIAMTGNPCEIEYYTKLYLSGKDFTNKQLDGCAMIHKDGVTRMLIFTDKGVDDSVDTFTRCLGSGEKWARAAMDFGCTPEKAIEYAMTRDTASGGKVNKVLFSELPKVT